MKPRAQALQVLTRVLSDQMDLDSAIEAVLEARPIEAEDRAWLLDVCAGTLRWMGRLNLAIDSVAIKKKPSGFLRKALLLAAYQLLVQENTPAAWVVSETVDLVKNKEGEFPAKFVNAVLRKISDHAQTWKNLAYPGGKDVTQAAQWASLPEWLWRRCVAARGEPWAQHFAQVSLERPKTWLLPLESMEPKLIESVAEVKPLLDSGKAYIQDYSSQVLVREVVEFVKKAHPVASGRALRALDRCAAPGGKSIALAWLGLEVIATDKPGHRFDRLRENLHRCTGAQAQVKPLKEIEEAGTFDLVWVDAPCTGSGTLRKNPEARWLKGEKDLVSLKKLQKELVEASWPQVAKGGFLMYTICSVLEEEIPDFSILPGASVEKHWVLDPQTEPGGDGFLGVIVRKV